MGGRFLLKYRLISAFVLIPVVIAALFLLPPVGFAIVTLVVCMLAAWEWGQLSGFYHSFAASMVGGVMRVIVGADAFSVAGISPKYSSTAG